MRTLNNFWTGDVNEATYKVRDSDYFLWEANSNRGGSSYSRSSGGLEQVHSGTDSTLPNREDSQIFNFAAAPNSNPSKASWNTSQQVQHSNQLDYLKHVDISRNKENQNMGKNQYQMSNGSHVLPNYQVGAGGTYEMQQTCYQKDNSYDNYGSKGSSGQEQEHVGKLKFIDNVSSSAVNFDKVNNCLLYPWTSIDCIFQFFFTDDVICLQLQGPLPDFQVNSKASEVPSRGDLDTSSTFHRSVGPHHSKVSAPTR